MEHAAKRPRHFWPVAAASLLWNAFGAYDWLMTNMRDAAYVAQFPPEMMQYVDAMPYWALASWALGVWAAALGSVLLLRRSRFAVHAFGASPIGLALSAVHSTGEGMLQARPWGLTITIWFVAIGLLWYAGRMRKTGVLG